MVLISCALVVIPMATSIYGLIIPNGIFGFGIGMLDSSIMPTMGYIVDIRYTSVYGSVYAIADAAFCLSFAAGNIYFLYVFATKHLSRYNHFLGPVLSGFIIQAFGFKVMLYIIAFICLCYAPLIFFLRNPPAKNEKTVNRSI
jgi:DHA1 family solute carrier family 18 vesicular amine transporter 1/2